MGPMKAGGSQSSTSVKQTNKRSKNVLYCSVIAYSSRRMFLRFGSIISASVRQIAVRPADAHAETITNARLVSSEVKWESSDLLIYPRVK
jgi:hypothetical protein